MAATRIGNPILKSAKSKRTAGVFTAVVKWTLKVKQSPFIADMLPENVAALFAAELPFEGNVYPGVPLATCRGVECETTKEGGVYIFTATYSDKNSKGEKKGTDDNPLKDRPIVLPVAGLVTLPMTRDRNDEAVLNSAGDPILVMREQQTVGLKVTANVASVPSFLEDLIDSQNDAAIVVDDEWTVKKEAARFILPTDWWSEPKNRNNIRYFEFKYELKVDFRDLHKGWPLDAGFREKLQIFQTDEDGNVILDANGDPVPELDPNGDPVFRVYTITEEADGSEPSEPVPLNGSGARLHLPTPSTVFHRESPKYDLADYSVLPGVV